MVTRVWNGGRGHWSSPSRWAAGGTGAAGAPEPGDTAAIPHGSVTVVGAQGLDGSIYDGVAVTLGDAADDPARLSLDGADFDEFDAIRALGSATVASEGASAIAAPITGAGAGTTLTIAGDAGAPNGLLLAHGASLSAASSATLDLRGVITAEAPITAAPGSTVDNGSTLRLVGSAATIGGSLAGAGTIDVEDAATLALDGSVAGGQTIAFGDVAGRLVLSNPGGFGGAIAGFKPGNSLDFTAVSATGADYDAATGILALTDASGAVVTSIEHVQAAAGALAVASDGSGGTLVTYAGAPSREQEQIQGADRAMRADVVRATMDVPGTSTPITGAGVKVGIISNSFDAYGTADADAAAGYLPANPDGTAAVTVLGADPAGDDEGREMAEEIHQVAPGAQLYFASAGGTQTSYAEAVAALQQAGCGIIANDVTALDGAMYQAAGPADVAVRQAVRAGVNVFTSGGNYAQSDIEQSFAPEDAPLPDGTRADAQIFDDGTPEEGITVAAGTQARIDLQWTAPYEGVDGAGAPQALSFELFRTDGTLVGQAKVATEGPTGTPTTDLYLTLPMAAAATTYDLVVTSTGQTPPPQGFKAILSSVGGGGRGPGGVFDDPEAGEGSGDERGVELVRGVNGVGASYFGNSAAFGGKPSFDEDFTSSGPGTLLYGPEGRTLSMPRSAGKLTFDAPDGVPVPNPSAAEPNADEKAFFGTSAAAPNAAAVAALMLQANPGLTTRQVTSLLEASASDQGLTPAQQGTGLIQADRAVALAMDAPDAGETLQSASADTFFNGGQAATTFVFHPGFGQDVIDGFLADGADHDRLSLPSGDFASIAEVLRDTAATPNGAVIHDPASGDTLTLVGVSRAELAHHRQDLTLQS